MIHGMTQEFINTADYFVVRNVRQGLSHKVAVIIETRNYIYNEIKIIT